LYDNITLKNIVVFVLEAIRNPRYVGSIFPSSHKLGQSIANHVGSEINGYIVELGAGTGSITKALIENGVTPSKLIIIERSEVFVGHLRRINPFIDVIQGDAAEMKRLLGDRCSSVGIVISSLPFQSLPTDHAQLIINALSDIVGQNSTLIQYTYNLKRGASHHFSNSFEKTASFTVWANIPPSRVETYRLLRDDDFI